MANIETISSVQRVKNTAPIARMEVGAGDSAQSTDLLKNRKKIRIQGLGRVQLELHPEAEKPHVIMRRRGQEDTVEIVDRGTSVPRSERYAAELSASATVVFPVEAVLGPEMARRTAEYQQKRRAGLFPTVHEVYAAIDARAGAAREALDRNRHTRLVRSGR